MRSAPKSCVAHSGIVAFGVALGALLVSCKNRSFNSRASSHSHVAGSLGWAEATSDVKAWFDDPRKAPSVEAFIARYRAASPRARNAFCAENAVDPLVVAELETKAPQSLFADLLCQREAVWTSYLEMSLEIGTPDKRFTRGLAPFIASLPPALKRRILDISSRSNNKFEKYYVGPLAEKQGTGQGPKRILDSVFRFAANWKSCFIEIGSKPPSEARRREALACYWRMNREMYGVGTSCESDSTGCYEFDDLEVIHGLVSRALFERLPADKQNATMVYGGSLAKGVADFKVSDLDVFFLNGRASGKPTYLAESHLELVRGIRAAATDSLRKATYPSLERLSYQGPVYLKVNEDKSADIAYLHQFGIEDSGIINAVFLEVDAKKQWNMLVLDYPKTPTSYEDLFGMDFTRY
jgi:hypothetical protein